MKWFKKIFCDCEPEKLIKRVEFNFRDYSFSQRIISLEKTDYFDGQFRVVVEITVRDNRGNIVEQKNEEHFVQEITRP